VEAYLLPLLGGNSANWDFVSIKGSVGIGKENAKGSSYWRLVCGGNRRSGNVIRNRQDFIYGFGEDVCYDLENFFGNSRSKFIAIFLLF
jgi:FtsP/CotA-like multicopper oxidase with cupredoxin domain